MGKDPLLRTTLRCLLVKKSSDLLPNPIEKAANMKPMRSHPRSGQMVRQLEGYNAFEPANLPPKPAVAFDNELVTLLSAADTAVGRLDGLARTLPDADLFLAMYVRQEALLSSQIEGTECTMDDILAFELLPHGGPTLDVGEVVNYVAALQHGVALLSELPLCNRLLREMHAVLLRSGRGADKSPGEFRRTQNWIGPAGCTLATASFVPPPRHVMESAMTKLETFVHDSTLPVLVTAGLAHAQFETITSLSGCDPDPGSLSTCAVRESPSRARGTEPRLHNCPSSERAIVPDANKLRRQDPDNGDALKPLVDSIDDPVRSSASAVAISQRRTKALADAMWVVEERSNDEFERSKRDSRWEFF